MHTLSKLVLFILGSLSYFLWFCGYFTLMDALAIANNTIGIAMGAAASDVVLETADVVLMVDKF